MPKKSGGLDLIIKHDHTYVFLFKISQSLGDHVMDCKSSGDVRRNVTGCSV